MNYNSIKNKAVEISLLENQGVMSLEKNCSVNQKYATTIKILEGAITLKNSEIKEQSKIIKTLIEKNKHLREQFEKTEKLLEEKCKELEKFAEKAEIITKLEEQLSESQRDNNDLQNYLKMSKEALTKRLRREQSALRKLQDALNIAEEAVVIKEEALKRERVLKEECENIASTIGEVMEEAARKVESDMAELKNKCVERERILNEQNHKLIQEVQNQKKFIEILNAKCKRFEQKYSDVQKYNEHLSYQLKNTAKVLRDLESKIKIMEYQNNDGNQQKILADQYEKTEKFIKDNRLLRERYNTTINDMTEQLERKVHCLQQVVAQLDAENQRLNMQINK